MITVPLRFLFFGLLLQEECVSHCNRINLPSRLKKQKDKKARNAYICGTKKPEIEYFYVTRATGPGLQ